ncbi:hypothetical protein CBR_g54643 [Chara braunii]|uniref:Uncharacterized protein n=1 Tax=Chara braunii TaxID=69332 RepID=A0A388MCA5_CHABU|nr:hypothetical protein CBR_g54643 [Chara braunii]|eukprot:GBG92198.1 hypothetical protein CBR_g54643 [Chara braunii]
MATNQPQQQQGANSGRTGRSPPRDRDVGLTEEARVKLLIAKCFEDGVSPENLNHGEFVVENGVRIFKVDDNVGRLTTSWLKDRVVTVIFQGAARDLPLKVRENLIRAYENGWTRQRIFDRTVRRGRTHGEGPNIISYIAMTREIAQWMVAKAEDKVVVGGVEYLMLFKPWMTRKELEERRRIDDETKFWVIALRVPIRAAFHLHDMLEKAMGKVIKTYDAEPDKTRPKLMNRKYDLVKEAECNFVPELPMKLEDGEILMIKFVCKHTPWCDRCRWWFHTETDGCPRMEEEDLGGAVERRFGNLNIRTPDTRSAPGLQRGIQEAARDVQQSTMQRRPQPEQGGRSRGESSNQGQAARTGERGGGDWGRSGLGGNPVHSSGMLYPQQRGAFSPYVGGGSFVPWQQQQAAGIWQNAQAWQSAGGVMLQGGQSSGMYPYPGYQGPRPSGLGVGYMPTADVTQPRREVERVERPGVEFRGEDRVSHKVTFQEVQPPPPGMDIEEVNPLEKRKEREGAQSRASSEASSTHGGRPREVILRAEGDQEGDSRAIVPGGLPTLGRGERENEDNFLLPFVCAIRGQEPYLIGFKASDGSMILPAAPIQGLPTPEIIAQQTRRLYSDRFQFRIFPEEMMAKLRQELPGGSRIRYSTPLIDARIPPECWDGLNNVGLECVRLSCIVSNEQSTLSLISVEPGVQASFLAELNSHLPRSRNLNSQYFVDALRGNWEATRLAHTEGEDGNQMALAQPPSVG